MLELLAATSNIGKIKEFKELFAGFPIRLRSLKEFGNIIEPEETGADFAENAILKARYYALKTNIWAVADDSGLEVAALDGIPGVFSARYGGENTSFKEKIDKLLDELNKTQDSRRLARFVCAMAISDEKGEIKNLSEGICDGKIALSPSGINGFGYDPIFIPAGFEETFGTLSSEIKHKISHRALASEKIIRFLRNFIVI
jgi:XTP/dITP diphosphohydrolase